MPRIIESTWKLIAARRGAVGQAAAGSGTVPADLSRILIALAEASVGKSAVSLYPTEVERRPR
jgi:hypothetical protein